MKYIKNQSGLALVIVLFLIVIFSVVGMAIMNFTVTNAKQTKNIEVDMQSVDAAEMGIIKYRNELITKVDTVLTADIQKAIDRIDAENAARAARNAAKKNGEPLESYIEVNDTTVLDEMKKDNQFINPNRFLLGYNPSVTYPVFHNSTEQFAITESPIDVNAPDFPQKIKIQVVSKGKSVDDENEINADFEFDLALIIKTYVEPGEVVEVEKANERPYLWDNDAVTLPIGTKDCNHLWNIVKALEDECIYSAKISNGYYINTHIENIDSHIKENLVTTGRDDLKLINTNLYVEGNVYGSTISQFSNSNIQSLGNITFGNMNGAAEFNNIKFKAKDKINLGTIGGTGISNSMLHGGEQVNIDNINNGGIINSQISSKKQINFENLNKGIIDSILYADENINFNGNMNDGGIIRSSLYSNNIINLNVMNKGIRDSYIYANNNLNFDNFTGQAYIENSIIHSNDIMNMYTFDSIIKNGTVIYAKTRINLNNSQSSNMNGTIEPNAFVCSGGPIASGIKAKGTKVNNVLYNVREYISFEECLALAGKSLSNKTDEVKTSNLKSITDSLKNAVDTADYTYK